MTRLESGGFYAGQKFSGLDLAEAKLESAEFQDCTFTDCYFQQATFKSCKFEDCAFKDCDLSLVDLSHSVFHGVKFNKCRLLGVDWGKASWGTRNLHSLLKAIGFKDCVVNLSSFVGLALKGLEMKGCVAHEADFSEADLSQADFSRADLEKARFRNTKLVKANFVGASNYLIDPAINDIKAARFSLPEAMGLLYAMDIEIVGEE